MYKMVFIVNKSLKMSSGKIASQTAHAAVSLYIKATGCSKKTEISQWIMLGQPKIVLKCQDDTSLIEVEAKAKSSNLLSVRIHDAGHTQIAAGSLTCLAVFGKTSTVDSITGYLSLL